MPKGRKLSRHTKCTAVKLVADKQYNAFPAATKLFLFNEECFEVIRTESLTPDSPTFMNGRRAGHKFGFLNHVYLLWSSRERLHKAPDGTGRRPVVVHSVAARTQHAEVVRVDIGVMLGGRVELAIGGRRS
jgi:hypothetical protein